MHTASLGLHTELMLRCFEGTVTRHDDYLVVRTPHIPTFRWGNYLVFDAPPGRDDVQRWPASFAAAFPDADHMCFGWDDPAGELGHAAALVAAGFALTTLDVLTTTTLPAVGPAADLRALVSDDDWAQWLALCVAQHDALPPTEQHGAGYLAFVRQRGAEVRRMIDAGWGAWFGAFVDGNVVASLGLIVRDGIGRYQDVDTHPRFRRCGLATALLHHAAAYGHRIGARRLVIVAQANSAARALYVRTGFAPTEKLVGLEKLRP